MHSADRPETPGSPPCAIFSVDVEDYFQVESFADVVDPRTWPSFASRVEANTRRLLDLLDQYRARGTFFILGWVAERYPALVREIVSRGHEPACHSYWHRRIDRLDRTEFREDTSRAKQLIEQAAGMQVTGYRAPSFSITAATLWALEILAELGFSYDSSIFPIHHDVYGIPNGPRVPFRLQTPSGPILECPMTTFRLVGSRNFPVGGGGYLRLLPFWYTELGIRRVQRENGSLILYIHPWEIDPEQPRLKGRLKSHLRHYGNLKSTYAKLERLLRKIRFASFRESRIGAEAPLVQELTKGRMNDQ